MHSYVDGDLRLYGTNSDQSQGRVEIYINGTWGTICSRQFAAEEAQVVCRQLRFNETLIKYSQAVLDLRFGEGTGPVYIDDIKCLGYEKRLNNCMISYCTNNYCNQINNVGVICYGTPCATPNPTIRPPTDVPTAGPGLGFVTDPGICNPLTNTVRLLRPPDIMAGAGVVELFHSGRWVAITDDCFDRNAAAVICRMLCYDSNKAIPGSRDFDISSFHHTLFYTNVTCQGYENSFSQCSHSFTSTSHCNIARVTCVDLISELPAIAPPSLNCDHGLITANLTTTWVGFVPYSHLSIVWHYGGVCSARRQDHVTYITYSIPFDECGTVMSWNRTHIIYKNAVLYRPASTGIITRDRTYMIYLTCVLPRDYHVEKPIIPISDSLSQVAISNYTIIIVFYIDNFLTEIIQYPIQIVVGYWLQVVITLVNYDARIKLVVPNCYATPSSDRNHPIRYPLFTEKCKDDPTVTFFCLSEWQFGFRYQTFKFVQYNEVHIHCEAYVCPKADTSPECDCLCHDDSPGQIGKRKKRDANRKWIYVKSKVILMTDPAEVGNHDHVAPTRPSYVYNSSTPVYHSPAAPAPTQIPADGAISAIGVIKDKDRTHNKEKPDTDYRSSSLPATRSTKPSADHGQVEEDVATPGVDKDVTKGHITQGMGHTKLTTTITADSGDGGGGGGEINKVTVKLTPDKEPKEVTTTRRPGYLKPTSESVKPPADESETNIMFDRLVSGKNSAQRLSSVSTLTPFVGFISSCLILNLF